MNMLLLTDTFASVYSDGTYDCSSYTNGCVSVGSPNTGFFEQPPQILYPALIGAAILVGTATFLISRAIRKRRAKHGVSFTK